MTKERVVVICPGRGSYTKQELGYLNHYRTVIPEFIEQIDTLRKKQNQPTISELDQSARFSPSLHLPGENASSLIYACAMADFMSINKDKYDIVAVTGNSMGWYIALACAGVLNPKNAFQVINSMGSMMQDKIIGGQIVYPLVDKYWQPDDHKISLVNDVLEQANQQADCKAYISIKLGGFVVIGANEPALKYLQQVLPNIEDTYPLRLNKHAAFHTPLLNTTSEQAFKRLPEDLFNKPALPLIDGRGAIWQPYSSRASEIYRYTLSHQVKQTYDFTASITMALKEFAPDKLILLGPGSSLGGSIGQILVKENWEGIGSKQDFIARQKENPFLLAMGLAEQKALAA